MAPGRSPNGVDRRESACGRIPGSQPTHACGDIPAFQRLAHGMRTGHRRDACGLRAAAAEVVKKAAALLALTCRVGRHNNGCSAL
jgi:hypothetical protein